MFRVRYLLGLVLALTLVLAASGLAPQVATAQEKDEFNCPREKICFYDGELYNGSMGGELGTEITYGEPGVVADPPSSTEVCHGLEWGNGFGRRKGVPFAAASVRNNTGARLVLFADDNCTTPVTEPTGGVVDGHKGSNAVRPKARSYEAVELPVEPEATTQQQVDEIGGLAGDGVALLDDGWDQFLGEQGPSAQPRREVSEHSSAELGHERARARRLERLVREGREGDEPAPQHAVENADELVREFAPGVLPVRGPGLRAS